MKYIEPDMEVVEVEQNDVITTSLVNGGSSTEDGENDFNWN